MGVNGLLSGHAAGLSSACTAMISKVRAVVDDGITISPETSVVPNFAVTVCPVSVAENEYVPGAIWIDVVPAASSTSSIVMVAFEVFVILMVTILVA